jgi:hypothetical protein
MRRLTLLDWELTMNARTLNIIQGTIQDIRYVVEPVGNDPTKPNLSNPIYNFFEAWTQASYDAWVTSGEPSNF